MGKSKLPMRQASIQLFGRLTRDPEIKTSDTGKASCGFSLAVERWTGTERVSWFANCRAFGPVAEKFADKARKGMTVFVTGEPYMEEWTAQDGTKKKDLKVFANTVDLLEWPDDGDDRAPREQAPARQRTAEPAAVGVDEDDSLPF